MADLEHPVWRVVVGTGGAYLVLLAVMTVLLFLIPYLVFVYL